MDQKQDSNKDLANNNETDEEQQENESQGEFLHLIKSNMKVILSAGLVFIIIIFILMSNLLTGYITFIVTRKIIQRNLVKKEKDIELNQLLGPVFLFGSSDYMVEFNDEPIYLRINLDFQLENLAMLDEVREKSPRIHNIVREVITNKSVNEFKARAGMQTARRLMLESINRILTKGKIKDIYFLDYRFLKSEYIEKEINNNMMKTRKGAENGE